MAVANHWILQDKSGHLSLSLEMLFCRGQRGQGWWDMSRSRDLDCEGKQESRIESPPRTLVSSRSSWGSWSTGESGISLLFLVYSHIPDWLGGCMFSNRLDTWDTIYTKMTSWIPRVMFWVLVLHPFTFFLVFVLPVLWQLIISMVIDQWYPKYMISPSNYAKELHPEGSLGTGESPWDGNSARCLWSGSLGRRWASPAVVTAASASWNHEGFSADNSGWKM